jgi:hypothetical protein
MSADALREHVVCASHRSNSSETDRDGVGVFRRQQLLHCDDAGRSAVLQGRGVERSEARVFLLANCRMIMIKEFSEPEESPIVSAEHRVGTLFVAAIGLSPESHRTALRLSAPATGRTNVVGTPSDAEPARRRRWSAHLRAVLTAAALVPMLAACGGSNPRSQAGHTTIFPGTKTPASVATSSSTPGFSALFPAPPARKAVRLKESGAELTTYSIKQDGLEFDVFELTPATIAPGHIRAGLSQVVRHLFANFGCTTNIDPEPHAVSGEVAVTYEGACKGQRSFIGTGVARGKHLYFAIVEGTETANVAANQDFVDSFTLT